MLKWIQSFGKKQEEKLPPPPKGSIRTRCYRLNLDAPIILYGHDHQKLIDVEQGPITYEPPNHLLPSSPSSRSSISKRNQHQKENEIFRAIINATPSNDSSFSSNNNENKEEEDDDSEYKSDRAMAIETAQIFRDLEVDEKGIIRSKNERATRSEQKDRKERKERKAYRKHTTTTSSRIMVKKDTSDIHTRPIMKEIDEEVEEINSAKDPSVVHYDTTESSSTLLSVCFCVCVHACICILQVETFVFLSMTWQMQLF